MIDVQKHRQNGHGGLRHRMAGRARRGKLPRGRGLGIGCSHYVSGAANSIIRSDMPHSTVNIKISVGN